MPQDKLRSVVYRSFLTCDDPRGVIEGKTIKLFKTDSTRMESQRQPKNSNRSSSPHKREEKEKMPHKRATEALDIEKPPSSYQLMEVKNGAQKLNQVIDSWSKGVGFEGQSKDIAKDLLKGALDLQESLMVLGKLQEASQYRSKLKKKQKEKSNEEALVDRIRSDRFENRNFDMGSRNSARKDCYEELRDVIRDGLARQNLLPNWSIQESVPLSSDIASTSSSRSSSMVYSHEFNSSDSFTSRATEEKSKGSNLIAKLMGLEEFPSRALHSSPPKQLESRRIDVQKQPAFDIDLPKLRKPHFFVQKTDRKQMTLDEIIEMMQSKGLLSSSKHEIQLKPKPSSYWEKEAPPIVLMKPHRKVKADANPMRKLHREKARAEEKEVRVTKGKLPSSKQKASVPVPVVSKPQRKEETEKRIDKIQKTAPTNKKKPAATESMKSTSSVSKIGSPKQVKPQRSVISNPLSTTKSSNLRKNVKIEKPLLKIVKNIQGEDEVLPLENQLDSIISDAKTAPNEEKTQDSVAPIKEIDDGRRQSRCEATVSTTESTSTNETFRETEVDRSEIRNSHEESGFPEISKRKVRVLQTLSSFQDSEPDNSKLLLDCVNEFLEHDSLRRIPAVEPLLKTSLLKSRFCVSEDQLSREVMNGIENLRNYSKLLRESCGEDTVYGLLERDLCWSTVGGLWSTGWKDGCTSHELEDVVLDLEKMVLSKLIDDFLMEILP